MNWLDKLKGKIAPPSEPAAQGEDTSRTPRREGGGTFVRAGIAPLHGPGEQDWDNQRESPPQSGRTVVRAGAEPGTIIPKPGIRFQPGQDVTPDLQIKTLIGSGGMGEVYLARQRLWDVDVALKIPKDEILADPENRHRIVREAEAWTDLGLHPNIAYCYYAQPLGEMMLLVIEFVDGGNLRDWIAGGRCADLKTGLELAIQFCHGLGHAHKKGLVHRDIKPENILLMQDGTLKITDFGIVRRAIASRERMVSVGAEQPLAPGMTIPGIGTAAYMAPEQWGAQSDIDLRTDIFAFGMCLYEMLGGSRPYAITNGVRQEAPDPGSMRGGSGLPERLCHLMKRCVDWDRGSRPETDAQVLAELCRIYEDAFGEPSKHAEMAEIATLADAGNNRALSYLVLGRVKDAEQAWAAALRADPRHLVATYNYGLWQWRLARTTDESLLRDLRESETATGDVGQGALLKARVLLESDNCEGAVAALDGSGGSILSQHRIRAAQAEATHYLPTARRCVRTLEAHLDFGVFSACLSADSQLALLTSFATVELWDLSTGRHVRTFHGHTSHVNSVCLSRDGRFALTGSGLAPNVYPLSDLGGIGNKQSASKKDNTLRLWDMGTGLCLRVFKGHTFGVNSVCLNADGSYALSGSSDGKLKLWDVATGRCVRTFREDAIGQGLLNPPEVTSVCISADGNFALSGSHNRLELWEVATGRYSRKFEGHTAEVTSVCLSTDGRLALSGSKDKTLRLWDLAPERFARMFEGINLTSQLSPFESNAPTGRCVRVFRGHSGEVTSVCLSTDGRFAISGSEDKTLRLWEVATGRCLRTYTGHANDVTSVCVSADGRFALSGSHDKTLKLWDLAGNVDSRAAPWEISRLVASGAAASASTVYRRCLKAGRDSLERDENVPALRALREARRQSGFQRDRQALVEYSKLYPLLKHARLAGGWEDRTLGGHTQHVTSVCLSAGGRFALSGSSDWELKLWKLETGRCLRTFKGHNGAVRSVDLNADAKYALSGDDLGAVKLWQLSTGHCLHSFKGHKGEVRSVCLSADGRFALSGSQDKTVRLWDVATGLCLRTFEGHSSWVNSVCLSADTKYALSGGDFGAVKLWQLATGKCLRTFEGHTLWNSSVCLSGDCRFALAGSHNKTLKLWDAATGECLRTFEGHTETVSSVCLSLDGRFALSGSWDKTVKLWDVATGQCLRTFEGHADWVTSVCLSADGRVAISGSRDNVLKTWLIDWDLEENETADWDEGARPFLEVFLRAQQPYAGELPQDHQPTDEEIALALSRNGRPEWSEDDFEGFLYRLGCAGYGWLRSDGVRRELERMTAEWGGVR